MKTNFIISAVILLTAFFTGCESNEVDLSVKGITLSKPTISLKPGNTETLTVTFFPENAVNKNVTWETSDETVASVNNGGLITANKPGNATITVTSVDGGEKATDRKSVV